MTRTRPRRHRPEPQAIDTRSKCLALRTVATFEAVKGMLVLLAGFGLLSLLHKDVGDVAERVVERLHMNPARHLSQVFILAASKVTDAKLWAMAFGAAAYSTVRFIEAYGLWHMRVWAEWFALLSGGIYLPWEIFELIEKPTPIHWALFLSNLVIVLYMLYIRVRAAWPVKG
jgi:uncharacterized membrane protein (DUF2068 family)